MGLFLFLFIVSVVIGFVCAKTGIDKPVPKKKKREISSSLIAMNHHRHHR